jgi:hypothetical protein
MSTRTHTHAHTHAHTHTHTNAHKHTRSHHTSTQKSTVNRITLCILTERQAASHWPKNVDAPLYSESPETHTHTYARTHTLPQPATPSSAGGSPARIVGPEWPDNHARRRGCSLAPSTVPCQVICRAHSRREGSRTCPARGKP